MNIATNTIKSVALAIAMISANALLAQPLNGAYTVAGASPDFANLLTAVNALNVRGVNGPVVFNIRDGNHSGTSWQATIGNVTGASSSNTITFQSQSGNKANCVISAAGSSSANYIIRLDDAEYIRIRNLTLENTNSTYGCDIRYEGSASYNLVENCMLTGHSGTSTSDNKSRIYGTSLSSAASDTFRNNTIKGGSYGIYFRGNNTSSTSNGHIFTGNTFDENYYYAIYAYYLGDILFNNNKVTRTGGGTYYGCYFYYTRNGIQVDNNEIDINATSTIYGVRFNYSNYSSNNSSAYVAFTNNKINITSTSGSVYPMDTRYSRYGQINNNTVYNYSASTSGNMYNYVLYSCYNSGAHDNSFASDKAGGYVRNYLVYSGSTDTFMNNTVKVEGNSYIYNYMGYQTQNYYVTNNDVSLKNSSRTIYGTYVYYYSGIFANNKIVHESNTGSVTGLYMDYANGARIYNNIVVTKTNGENYGVRAYYVYPATRFFNNTIYTAGAGSTSYCMYVNNSSASYGIMSYNNIFYKTDANGYNCYFTSKEKVFSEHNLYYKPSGDIFNGVKKSDNLHDWRAATGVDRNSLIYDVPFTDAANGDFSIIASSPLAWAVNARAMQDSSRHTDYVNTAVPRFVETGVPDIGAFEVTPTSTPPDAIATPAAPLANGTQVFTFGQDTVLAMEWGSTVPSAFSVRQYAGVKAAPVPAGLQRAFFYTEGTAASADYNYKAYTYYKDSWLGDIPSENDAVMARMSTGGVWEGFNYTNAVRDEFNNVATTASNIDSVGSYTIVRNGRIGIRCVYPPTGIRISNITANSADIDWDAIFNPSGYQVIVKKTNTSPTAADWAAGANPASNSVAVPNLDEDTKYYVFVRNICGAKDTSGYTIDSFITIITCHAPVITIVDVEKTRVVVYWDTVKTGIAYECAISTSPTPPQYGTTVQKTEMLYPYLDQGKKYYVHLRANCNTMYAKSDWVTKEFDTWAVNIASVNQDASMQLYPNPVADNMVVTLMDGINEGRLAVCDMTGKQVKSITVDNSKMNISVADLPGGVYILSYTGKGSNSHIRFTKL